MARCDIRCYGRWPIQADRAVIDVSSITLRRVLPRVRELLIPRGDVVALVKPQFEVGKGAVGKGGVVRDREQHGRVLIELRQFAQESGYDIAAEIPSPILGAKGNREFFLHLRRSG